MSTRRSLRSPLVTMLSTIAIAACADSSVAPPSNQNAEAVAAEVGTALDAVMTTVNTRLESSGARYRVGSAEWSGLATGGNLVLYKITGTKVTDFHWMRGDSRRGGRTDLTYAVDDVDGTADGVTGAQSAAALVRAMSSWSALNCGRVALRRLHDTAGADLGVTEFLLGLGGSATVAADITHAGWLPGSALPDGWIAATFTYFFLSDDNNDGKYDTYFSEIYYNDHWSWGLNASLPAIDIETAALHEAGHALSLEHHGKQFLTAANGRTHWAPLALMNPTYSGVVHRPLGTDVAAFCGLWSAW